MLSTTPYRSNLTIFLRSDSQQVRMHALERIIDLISMRPRFRPYFHDPVIQERLRRVSEATSLIKKKSTEWAFELELYQRVTFLAKQALLCIEDSPVSKIIDVLEQVSFVRGTLKCYLSQVSASLLRLLNLCK